MLKTNKNIIKRLYKRTVYGSAVPPLPENEPNVNKTNEKKKKLKKNKRFIMHQIQVIFFEVYDLISNK